MHLISKLFNTCSKPQLINKVFCDSLITGETKQHMQKWGMADTILSKDNDFSSFKKDTEKKLECF